MKILRTVLLLAAVLLWSAAAEAAVRKSTDKVSVTLYTSQNQINPTQNLGVLTGYLMMGQTVDSMTVTREDVLRRAERYVDIGSVTEEDDYDLMVMGRSQGQGCYCFVNGIVQTQVQKLQSHYPYIVVDNEAGMEHISRGILPNMEIASLVSDCSRRGVQAAGRIAALMKELNFHPKKVGLIVNRAPGGKLDEGTLEEIEKQKLDLLGVVPQDEDVYRFDCEGRPTVQLPKDSPVRAALKGIIEKLGI